MSKPIDWVDVILHVVVALAGVGAFAAVDLLIAPLAGVVWFGAAINAVAWPVREALQRLEKNRAAGLFDFGPGLIPSPKDRIDWCFPWLWSRQKTLEAWTPVAAGFMVAGGVALTRWAGTWLIF